MAYLVEREWPERLARILVCTLVILSCRPVDPPPDLGLESRREESRALEHSASSSIIGEDSISTASDRHLERAPSIKVSLSQFQTECEENIVAAEQKYIDKYIEFHAYVHDISTTWSEDGSLHLDPTKEHAYMGSFIASLRSGQRDKVAKLKKGKRIAVSCQCVRTAGGLSGADCEIID